MSKDTLHVVPHNDAWAVKREGNERPSSSHDTQRDAIENARNLAKEGDDIVIHRPDGTIRERSTYMLTSEKSNGSKTPVQPSDVMSVGTRVSWGAVLAGAVVALTVYATLILLTVAIGQTTIDQLAGKEKGLAIGTALVLTISLMASLFLGGYVASLTTAGETTRESIIYGVLVWGAMCGLLLMVGSSLTVGFGTVTGPLRASGESAWPTPEEMQQRFELTPEQQQKYTEAYANPNAAREARTALSWWAFATMVLSLLAAMAGSLCGAGPELAFRRIFVPQGTRAAANPV